MRGYFSFQAGSRKVEMLFNTWAFRKFCEKRGMSLSELLTLLGGSIGLHDLVDLMLAGTESFYMKHGKAIDFTEYDVTEWIDEAGLFADGQLMVGFGAAISSWINPQLPPAKEEVDSDEKKSN
ncbi:hypothetical protein UFOVP402_17 [uncultured Caudovirales phage]|uniref:Uncharacterized protein n=1 Tax=uncultured Caudovirales phage TaxID=2100421 RepID=A0A6J5M5C7_9CAUD|nr:hypothetical protein UFOVP402_17 [uncultured Caudovirales phage]